MVNIYLPCKNCNLDTDDILQNKGIPTAIKSVRNVIQFDIVNKVHSIVCKMGCVGLYGFLLICVMIRRWVMEIFWTAKLSETFFNWFETSCNVKKPHGHLKQPRQSSIRHMRVNQKLYWIHVRYRVWIKAKQKIIYCDFIISLNDKHNGRLLNHKVRYKHKSYNSALINALWKTSLTLHIWTPSKYTL